jgi:4-amino-4-deoxy-L-arabinose transferase-like glycosyltransferase
VYVGLGLLLSVLAPPLQDSGDNYPEKAWNVVQGRGITDSSTIKPVATVYNRSLHYLWAQNELVFGVAKRNQPTAFFEPGYILWLALWFKLLGSSPFLITLVQLLLMGLVIPMTYYLGKRVFKSEKVGVSAAIITAFNPMLLRFPQTFPCENLFIPLFVAGLCGWYWTKEKPSSTRVALLALIWAAAGLTRMVGIYFGVLVFVWLFISNRQSRKYLPVALGVFLLLWGSWVLRNSRAVGQARLLPTKVGYNLWDANNRYYLNQLLLRSNPDAHYPYYHFTGAIDDSLMQAGYGLTSTQVRELVRYDYPEGIASQGEVAIDKALSRTFRVFLFAHSGIVIKYAWGRFLETFYDSVQGLGQRNLRGLSAIYFLGLFLTAAIGLITALRRRDRDWFMLILLALYFLSIAASLRGDRFRVPVDPILAVLAGGMVLSLSESLIKRMKRI